MTKPTANCSIEPAHLAHAAYIYKERAGTVLLLFWYATSTASSSNRKTEPCLAFNLHRLAQQSQRNDSMCF